MLSFNASQDPDGVLTALFTHVAVKNSPEGVFRILGFVHLYQASGIHLLVFFSFLEFGLEKLWLKSRLPIRASKTVSLVLCSIAGFWIWSLQNFALSFARPMLTFYIRSFFKSRGAIPKVLVPLACTLLLDVLIREITLGSSQFGESGTPTLTPVFTTGALHFYLSVAGGLLALDQSKTKNSFLKHAAMALGSWLPIAMIDFLKDHLISFMTPIYSLITIPVIAYVLYPVSLILILFTHRLPDFWCEVWKALIAALKLLPDLGLTWVAVQNEALWIASVIAGIWIWAFAWLKNPKIKLAFSACAIFVMILGRQILAQSEGPNRVVQLDVKQGDSALIQRRNENELTDVGSFKKLKEEAWIRKLARYQVTDIHGILLTHLDEDHIGGLAHLLPLVPIDCIETHRAHWESEKGAREYAWLKLHYPRVNLASSDCIGLSQVSWFQSREKNSKGNDLMAGSVYEFDRNRAYFALGDGDMGQETAYGKAFKEAITSHPVRIWKVSHHGSKYSSDPDFLSHLDPSQFWISVGKKNPYHHPHPFTLIRLRQQRGVIHRTDQEGDLASDSLL